MKGNYSGFRAYMKQLAPKYHINQFFAAEISFGSEESSTTPYRSVL